MVEAQQSIGHLLIHLDQAGGFFGLVLGFVLGMIASWMIVFYQGSGS